MSLSARAILSAIVLLATACGQHDNPNGAATSASRPVESNDALSHTGDLRIAASVTGAEIFINDTLVGTGRLMRRLAAGSHRLVVRAPGYKQVEREVTVRANDVTLETVTLEKVANPDD